MGDFKEFYMANLGNSCRTFKGRLTRRQFAVANLLIALTTTVLVLICMALMFLDKSMVLGVVLIFITTIITFAMTLSIYVRRLHDLGYSGVAMLLIFVPVINLLFALAMVFMRGDVGANEYGEDILPQDIGEEFILNEKNISLIKGLPVYIVKNMYGHMYFNKLLRTSGRANRKEYFIKLSSSVILYQLLSLLATFTQVFFKLPMLLYLIIQFTIVAGLLFIFIAVDIRRSHDRGKGWMHSLWFIVPVINIWHMAKQMNIVGESTSNPYGECTVELSDDGVPLDDF